MAKKSLKVVYACENCGEKYTIEKDKLNLDLINIVWRCRKCDGLIKMPNPWRIIH